MNARPRSLPCTARAEADGDAERAAEVFADKTGFVLLCPDSRGFTWDAIRYYYTPEDVRFINIGARAPFEKCNIDPNGSAIAASSRMARATTSYWPPEWGSAPAHRRVFAGMLLTAIDAFKPPVYITPGPDGPPDGLTSIPIVEELEARRLYPSRSGSRWWHWIPAATRPSVSLAAHGPIDDPP